MYFFAPNSNNDHKISHSTQILVIFLQYFNEIRTFLKKTQAILKRNSSKFWKNSTRNSKNSSKMSTRCSTVLRISVKKHPCTIVIIIFIYKNAEYFCRPDGITSYLSKFPDATMSLEVAEIWFSNLVLQAIK